MAQQKEQWGSRLGVILAVAGSAVGLGNFLRFPGQAAQHGGGAFMIPYFCALFLLGIPICWAEWTMGRYGGRKGFRSAPAILGVIGRGRVTRYIGTLGLLIPLAVFYYYALVEAWCLRYFFEYLVGGVHLGSDPSGYVQASQALFTRVAATDANGLLLHGIHPTFVFWIITGALNFWLIYRGLSKGIEAFCSAAMPTMAVCALIVLGRVLTLGTPLAGSGRSVLNGLGFMWNPNFHELTHFATWLAAGGQIFFTLSVGFGVIINYAAYLGKKDDVVLSGLTASATNELFEVGFGGLITIPAAFVFLGATAAVGGTFGLGFNTLPVVFQYMGSFGRFIGAVWFLMLFLAAITSSLSMLQPVLAFLGEAMGWDRKKAAAVLGVMALLGSLFVIFFSQGLTALDTIDFWVGTFLVFAMAAVQIITFAWVFGIKRGWEEAHTGALIRIPRIFMFIMKYVSPLYLLVVLVGFCIQSLPGYVRNLSSNRVAVGSVAVIAVTWLVFLVMTRRGELRWRELDLDLDGKYPPND